MTDNATTMVQQPYRTAWATGPKIFKCTGCNNTAEAERWKFCAYCGAEILRFERLAEEQPVTVVVTIAEPSEKPSHVKASLRIQKRAQKA
jgi:hypothetical protein